MKRQLSISIEENVFDKLKTEGFKRGLSVSGIVNEAIRYYFAKIQREFDKLFNQEF